MEFLRKFSLLSICLALFQCLSCSPTTTVIDYIETDTYISTTDSSNHADLSTLRVSKTASTEERAVFKLPTGKGTIDDNLSDLFSSPLLNTPLNPFFILEAILQQIVGCTAFSLSPSQLTAASLVFNVNDNGGQSLGGLISLKLLNRPWWQNTDWLHAHFFSETGAWTAPGGDFDTTFTPVASVVSGSTITFDITTYFQSLISSSSPVHYGMMLVASSSLQPVVLSSAQTTNSGSGPRVVSTYNCVSPSGLEQGTHELNLVHNTYYLGSMSKSGSK
jgi:hypothetical protein